MCLYTVAMCHYIVVFSLAVCVVSRLPMCSLPPQPQLVTADGFLSLRLIVPEVKMEFYLPAVTKYFSFLLVYHLLVYSALRQQLES